MPFMKVSFQPRFFLIYFSWGIIINGRSITNIFSSNLLNPKKITNSIETKKSHYLNKKMVTYSWMFWLMRILF